MLELMSQVSTAILAGHVGHNVIAGQYYDSWKLLSCEMVNMISKPFYAVYFLTKRSSSRTVIVELDSLDVEYNAWV